MNSVISNMNGVNDINKNLDVIAKTIKCPYNNMCGYITYTEDDLQWTKNGRLLKCPKCGKKIMLHKMYKSNIIKQDKNLKEG